VSRQCNPDPRVQDGAATADRIERSLISVREVLQWLLTDRYLSKRAASQYTGLSVNTIEAGYRSGALRAFNLRKKVLLLKSDIDQWIQSHEVQPTAKPMNADRGALNDMLSKCIERARKNMEPRR
jgi:excisionase family DNA binding protein